MSNSDTPTSAPAIGRPWRTVLIFLLLLVALQLVLGPRVQLSKWRVNPDANAAWLEARAWLDGRADLGVDQWDLAKVDGRFYNPLPPLFTFFSCFALFLRQLHEGQSAGAFGFYPLWYVGLIAVPLPMLGFWAFRNALRSRYEVSPDEDAKPRSEEEGHAIEAWAAVLTFAWLAGTSMVPTLTMCRTGNLNYINHALSQVGLLLIIGDLFGARRWWPAALGLVIGAWSRQLTIAFALPLLWVAL